jgi:hypothetical protein
LDLVLLFGPVGFFVPRTHSRSSACLVSSSSADDGVVCFGGLELGLGLCVVGLQRKAMSSLHSARAQAEYKLDFVCLAKDQQVADAERSSPKHTAPKSTAQQHGIVSHQNTVAETSPSIV